MTRNPHSPVAPFDFLSGRRGTVLAPRAMIATSHPLATSAGLEVLFQGGNAVDAAITAVAVQSVVDPLMTGLGGDCFALIKPAGQAVRALNGSGRAVAAAEPGVLAGLLEERPEIPLTSPHAVTIPGAVSAWCRLHADCGTSPLSRLFAAAIRYARDGFPVTPRVAHDWAQNTKTVAADPHAAAIFLPGGRAPQAGEMIAQPLLAERLEQVAAQGPVAFYDGAVGQGMAAYLAGLGGLHTAEDFRAGADAAQWVEPICAMYRGNQVWECPPNGQGLAALIILRILDGFDLGPEVSVADRTHLLAEATRIAYHHRDALIADPAQSEGLAGRLLSDTAIAAMRSRIRMDRAGEPVLWDQPEHSDTVYLCVVDSEGNAVSLINSIFHPFGSGLLDPASGVLFQNRGASFRLDPGHPNAIGPGKRPMHTIIPGMVVEPGGAVMPFGVMGGHYQATGHAGFLSGVYDLGLDLQAAIDAPRSFAIDGRLDVEPTLDPTARDDLAARGHKINVLSGPMGGAQAIRIDPVTGVKQGASESRKDGMALGY
ncbi:gamma-glutamyltransferase family protein [Paracoccus pacificus]|uniref:Gamma-glutamyltransferase family protein n=1 Tax=Paracoccus pacificus TaxID=1463598 RepID=A0ABW4R2U1_9RHOB